MKDTFFRERSNTKGITLIALVVTIIVLLILAGISLSMLMGNNGIISQATKTKESAEEGEIRERIRLAVYTATLDELGTLTENRLRHNLNNEFGDENYSLEQDEENEDEWIIIVETSSGKNVTETINIYGIIESSISDSELKRMLEEVVGDATIDEYGNIGNSEDWNVVRLGEGVCTICSSNGSGDKGYHGNSEEIIIPKYFKNNGEILKLIEIGDHTFFDNNQIKSIIIPNSVVIIREFAIRGCYNLTSITIPNSVTNIESYAFDGCRSLTSITIPNSVTSLGSSTFYYLSELTNITIQKEENSISGSPWGAEEEVTITWTGKQ